MDLTKEALAYFEASPVEFRDKAVTFKKLHEALCSGKYFAFNIDTLELNGSPPLKSKDDFPNPEELSLVSNPECTNYTLQPCERDLNLHRVLMTLTAPLHHMNWLEIYLHTSLEAVLPQHQTEMIDCIGQWYLFGVENGSPVAYGHLLGSTMRMFPAGLLNGMLAEFLHAEREYSMARLGEPHPPAPAGQQ